MSWSAHGAVVLIIPYPQFATTLGSSCLHTLSSRNVTKPHDLLQAEAWKEIERLQGLNSPVVSDPITAIISLEAGVLSVHMKNQHSMYEHSPKWPQLYSVQTIESCYSHSIVPGGFDVMS